VPVACVLALTGALIGSAQQSPREFEAATIKPTNPAGVIGALNLTSGGRRVEIAGFTFFELVGRAYRIAPFQISAPPSLLNHAGLAGQRYDITALARSDAPVGPDQVDLLLRQLLSDRFGLKTHREKRQLPAYSLVVARTGAKIHEGVADETNFDMSGGRIKADMVPISMLARILGNYMNRPVLDETGLQGKYNFELTWTPGELEPVLQPGETGAVVSGPSIFTALRDQLGLKLESKKSPVEILVIDRAEKPSEN
jgi:uncharacterized protein (TIGR03435 family)